MKKIKLLRDSANHKAGDVVDASELLSRVLIKRGIAEEYKAKRNKRNSEDKKEE